MGTPEQLVLDLGRGPWRRQGPRPAGWRVRWHLVGRFLLSALVAVVLAGVAVSLSPYRTSVAGVQVVVTGTVDPSHRGITLDSTLGNLEFRHVTALPLGVHVTPRVDLETVRSATGVTGFPEQVRADLRAQVPHMAVHFVLAAVVGLVVGALLGGLLFDGLVLLLAAEGARRGGGRRRRLAEAGLRVFGITVAASLLATVVTVTTYDSDFASRYTVTGLLADLAATPDRLTALDTRDAAASDKIRAVLRLQDALTAPPTERDAVATAFRVLFISDVHRRNIYPYLQQYVDANDVALVVDTGDETLVGNSAELTPDYLASIAAVTARTPMVWVKGNHDSAAVAAVMDAVPGVTVLDGQVLDAFGLQLYATGDPRTYGAPGAAGSDDPGVVTRVETAGAAAALRGLRRDTYLDLLLAHEPVEADVLADALGRSVRAQASGHVHRQNAESDLQTRGRGRIRLVEGTTGLGGLLADGDDPMSFSLLSVAPDCQYTRIVRYQLADPALPVQGRTVSFGDSSSFVVHYFDPQPISADRTCSRSQSLGVPVDAGSTAPSTVEQWGAPGAARPGAAVPGTPSPVSSGDEAADDAVATPGPPPSPPDAR